MSEFGVSISRESIEEGARRIAAFGVSSVEVQANIDANKEQFKALFDAATLYVGDPA